jgi:malate dehydrogenase
VKVTIVGAGNVGATCAQRIAEADIADVALIDIAEGLAAGKALDLAEAAPLVGHSRRIVGGEDYALAEGSDVVVITAGLPRKPGMTRDDLLAANGEIITQIMTELKQTAPDAIYIIVTNPLDVTTYVAHQVSGLRRERIMGMAGALDTARFCAFIAMELGCAPADVQAMVLGGHGDSMVPLPRYSTAGGMAVTELISSTRLDEIVERTRQGGAEIVSYLKTGSAFYAPAAGVARMVSAIVRDEKRLMPASVLLRGEYGLKDVFVGVPVKLGTGGVEEIIELDLTEEELSALHDSAEHVRRTVARWENLQEA